MKNLFLLVCFISFTSFAQNIATVDSLLTTIDVDDTSHIHRTIDVLNLSKQLQYDKGEANAYHKLGFIYNVKNSFPLSMEKYYKAIELYKGIGDQERVAAVKVNIAYVFNRMKDFDNEIKHAEEALKITKDDSLRAYAYTSIGKGLMGLGKTKEAIEAFNKAVDIKIKTGQSHDLHKFYNALGVAYIRSHQYDSAISTLWKINRYGHGRIDVIARMYNNLGVAHHFKKEYQNAELNYLEAVALDDRCESGSACLNYAELLHETGHKQKARHYLARALDKEYELGHLGRTLFAMEMYKESALVRDSLFTHATKDFQQIRKESVSIATIESDLKNAREKAALKEASEANMKLAWAVGLISFLVLAMAGKYIWSCRHKLKGARDLINKLDKIFTPS